LIAYSRQFSQSIGHEFTDRTILLTVITGSAAKEIGGHTSASVYHYMRRNDYATNIKFFTDKRLSFIDKISFASYNKILGTISKNFGRVRYASHPPAPISPDNLLGPPLGR
jgi:hypothetical protein